VQHGLARNQRYPARQDVAHDWQAVLREMTAKIECLTIAKQVNAPAPVCSREREYQTRQPQPRLPQIGRDQDSAVVPLTRKP